MIHQTDDKQIDQHQMKQVVDLSKLTGDRFSKQNEQQLSHSDMFKKNFQSRTRGTGNHNAKRKLENNYKSLMTDHERKELQHVRNRKGKS